MFLLYQTPITRLKKARDLYGRRAYEALRSCFLASVHAELVDGTKVKVEQICPEGQLLYACQTGGEMKPLSPDTLQRISY
ncbi:hypothetical protein CKO28_02730 [Rhodovibrio sodomensis]|uniref:Uncharacterized protein n=1 Tax=Rhodovibrio sodomensis TaxID=1088 RepID=A0ABS1D967_9PROT|nr:hypothetical protein [Rhodovibrio sodomensis]MBK1666958.1 hypothetical protein [Rhodovibrio sodomensis]